MELHPSVSIVPFPFIQSWKVCSWGFSSTRSKASVQILYPIVELGPAQHQTSYSPLIHCVGVHVALGHVGECGSVRGRKKPGAEEHENSTQQTPLFRSLSISDLPVVLAVASDLFPGVINRQVPSQCHLDFTGHASELQLPCMPILFDLPRACQVQHVAPFRPHY